MTKKTQSQDFIKTGKRVINSEARALDKLEDSIEKSFSDAIKLHLGTTGRVIISGMGKSGNIA